MGDNDPKDLASIVEEVLDCIGRDQWLRLASKESGAVGYQLGAAAMLQLEEAVSLFDTFRTADFRYVGARGQGYIRRQLGEADGAHSALEKARHRLVALGESPDRVDAFLENPGADTLPVARSNESVDAFSDYLNAWIDVRLVSGDPATVARLENEIAIARSKLFLRDFRGRYRKILDRCGRLAPLGVEDDRIAEACRAYLYGFYRSAVLLAWAACEARLRVITGRGGQVISTDDLLAEAQTYGALPLDGVMRRGADSVAGLRNRVAHEAHDPSSTEAEQALDFARHFLEHLQQAGPRTSVAHQPSGESHRGRLELTSTALIDGLRMLAASQPRDNRVVLTFDGADLRIVCGRSRVDVPAKGFWSDAAVTSRRLIGGLLKRRDGLTGSLVLIGTATHLHLSHFVLPCTWGAPKDGSGRNSRQ